MNSPRSLNRSRCRQVLECASPLALWELWVVESARGLVNSETLTRPGCFGFGSGEQVVSLGSSCKASTNCLVGRVTPCAPWLLEIRGAHSLYRGPKPVRAVCQKPKRALPEPTAFFFRSSLVIFGNVWSSSIPTPDRKSVQTTVLGPILDRFLPASSRRSFGETGLVAPKPWRRRTPARAQKQPKNPPNRDKRRQIATGKNLTLKKGQFR
jgi:hypothetical protein